MDQLEPEPQNTCKSFKRLVVPLSRLGCHNAICEQEELLELGILNTSAHHNTSYASPGRALAEPVGNPDIQSNTFFQNANDVKISGNAKFQSIGSITNVYGQQTDKKLKTFVLFDAEFDSIAQDPDCLCHPGTRENVLKRLRYWIDNSKSTEAISWLYGPAGAGKSAIARTIARSDAQSEVVKVAATFFCFRSDVNRNNANRLITTLAYQLARSMPSIGNYITYSLNRHPDLPRKDVETQFKHLLVRPFQALWRDNASTQLAQDSAPVIIIDGIDEFADENFQQRVLEAIDDAIIDDGLPLRFLIVTRPERHIEQTMDCFRTPILHINLARLDDAEQDINKYLTAQFSRIASNQGLAPTWPGQDVIDGIIHKSSGNFIFPSLVIKCVSDLDNTAENLLKFVLNTKSPKITTTTPLAVLDRLFLEILGRVPDQDFLKRYLDLLVSRISVSSDYRELHIDDPLLMHVCREELNARLRRMRSLLKFEPEIDVHHLTFVDFLHNSTRSGQYFVPRQGGIMRYLRVFIDSFARYVSTVIEESEHYDTLHFNPFFRPMIAVFPQRIKLSVNEWQNVTQPLLDLQDKLLQSPISTWEILRCNNCVVFHILRELLYQGQQLEIIRGQPKEPDRSSPKCRREILITSKEEISMNSNLDSVLLPLFDYLREEKEIISSNEELIKLVNVILLRFDHAETAVRVRFVSDAQKLVDLLIYLINEKNALSPDAIRKATQLTLEIFSRVPILPLSPFLKGNNKLRSHPSLYGNIPIQILSQTIIASRVLDRRYIIPALVSEERKNTFMLASSDTDWDILPIMEWRRGLMSSSLIQMMYELAKAIQYFHSMGVILHREFDSRHVFVDTDVGMDRFPRVRCLCSISQFESEQSWKEWFSPEGNVLSFGCIFYELFSDVDTKPSSKNIMSISESRPTQMPDHVWQLIRTCCVQGPGNRLTMSDLVQTIESWKNE